MLALVVELLVTALTGAALGFEATSFFVDEGNRPRLGQAFLVIDPDALAGRDRLRRADRDADRGDARRSRCSSAGRAPRRVASRGARADGVEIPPALADQLEALGAERRRCVTFRRARYRRTIRNSASQPRSTQIPSRDVPQVCPSMQGACESWRTSCALANPAGRAEVVLVFPAFANEQSRAARHGSRSIRSLYLEVRLAAAPTPRCRSARQPQLRPWTQGVRERSRTRVALTIVSPVGQKSCR